MKLKYFIIPVLSLLCLNKVYADCTKEEISNFKKIESEFTVTYEFDKSSQTYTLLLNNPSTVYTYFIPNTITGEMIEDGSNYKITGVSGGKYEIGIIKEDDDSCTDTLKTIKLDLPKYNKYYSDPLCEGIEEFYLCQETYDKEVDRKTFETRVETYKKTKSTTSTTEEDDSNQKISQFNKVKEFIAENIIEIVIAIAIVVVLLIATTVLVKSSKKRRRLE